MGKRLRVRDEKGHFVSSKRSYEFLLDYPSIINWDMTLRSSKTKEFYYYAIQHFLVFEEVKKLGVNAPDDLLEISDLKAVDLIAKFSYKYLKKGKSQSAQMIKVALKSFYAANDRYLKSRKLATHKVARKRETYSRIIPTKDQAFSMAGAAVNLRDKAIILTIFQSGLRNNTLRRLTVGHVRRGLKNNEVPLKIDIDPMIDKQSLREPYYTFIDIEAVDAIRLYLDSKGGLGSLPDDVPLFSSTVGKNRMMSDMSVLRAIKRAAKNARIDPKRISPHCLRKSFYNMLVGKVDDIEREFMFGHNMGIREYYFAPQWVDKLRKAYARVDWHRFPTVALTKEDIRTEVISTLLGKINDADLAPIAQRLGISPQQIRTLIQRARGNDQLEKRETETLLKQEKINNRYKNNHYTYKMLTENELCKHLDENWDLVKELSNGKLVVRKPNDLLQ